MATGHAGYPPFAVTVDLVVLTVRDDALKALAVRRSEEPYRGRWALPGGFVGIDEDLPAAAVRELTEETGLAIEAVHLEQLATYGEPRRDPRGRTVSVAYLALAPDLPHPRAGSDAADADWVDADRLLRSRGRLAFDHAKILADGVERARSKLEYSPLAAAFCAVEFTVADLRRIYEIVWDAELDPRNFHRKVTGTPGFLVPVGRMRSEGGRPAALFRVGEVNLLHPALLRPAHSARLQLRRATGTG
jgi:ADP-ribose pyrophosphatase YjhB (NUDIX family)